MAGWASITGDETIGYCDNMSFDGSQRGGKMTADGDLYIGATDLPHVRKGSLTAGTGITITPGPGTIEIGATASVLSTDMNLGIAYNGSTGVFTVQGADGTALSASNPGYVTLQSKATPGQLVTIAVTANQSFIDDVGASEIIGNLFGLDTGVAYAEDIPFYLYAVSNDAEDAIAFMISRVPHALTSPVLAKIGAPDDVVASTQGSFFSLENIDETLYDENPCLLIGAFRMQMSNLNDWTVQTLSGSDGIGQFHERTRFNFPVAVFGASAGTHLRPNGGMAPVFSTSSYTYSMQISGIYFVNLFLFGDGGADGTGAVQAQITMPYECGATQNFATIRGTLPTPTHSPLYFSNIANVNYSTIIQVSNGVAWNNNLFTTGARQVSGYFPLEATTV